MTQHKVERLKAAAHVSQACSQTPGASLLLVVGGFPPGPEKPLHCEHKTMIHVDPIEIPKPVRPNMCEISYDMLSRADILVVLSENVHANIKATEDMYGIKICANLDALFYQIGQVFDAARNLADTHAKHGWVLREAA